MARCSPPARGEQSRTSRSLDVLEMGDLWVIRVGAEAVLLVVAGTEDVVACAVDAEDGDDVERAEYDWVDAQVASLDGVDEGKPGEVAKCKHEAKAISCDIHGCENCGLHPESIEHIDCLCDHNDHCRRSVTTSERWCLQDLQIESVI